MKNSKPSINWELGCCLPFDEWAWLNSSGIFEDPSLRNYVAPFPPRNLMHNVSGLTNERDFAKHGVDIFQALVKASSKPLTEFQHILDFGCGCGRLARMFKGHPNKITGCDIDHRHIRWLSKNLDYMTSILTRVKPPLPFSDNEFDAVISISVFTHVNEQSQYEFLAELFRITKPGCYLFLTIHGSRVLERAKNEKIIWDMLAVDKLLFKRACVEFGENRHAFILQHGHLTKLGSSGQEKHKKKILKPLFKNFRNWFRSSPEEKHNEKTVNSILSEPYQYGMTFIPEDYVLNHWGKWFNIIEIRQGAVHAFQDIVVLRPKK